MICPDFERGQVKIVISKPYLADVRECRIGNSVLSPAVVASIQGESNRD